MRQGQTDTHALNLILHWEWQQEAANTACKAEPSLQMLAKPTMCTKLSFLSSWIESLRAGADTQISQPVAAATAASSSVPLSIRTEGVSELGYRSSRDSLHSGSLYEHARMQRLLHRRISFASPSETLGHAPSLLLTDSLSPLSLSSHFAHSVSDLASGPSTPSIHSQLTSQSPIHSSTRTSDPLLESSSDSRSVALGTDEIQLPHAYIDPRYASNLCRRELTVPATFLVSAYCGHAGTEEEKENEGAFDSTLDTGLPPSLEHPLTFIESSMVLMDYTYSASFLEYLTFSYSVPGEPGSCVSESVIQSLSVILSTLVKEYTLGQVTSMLTWLTRRLVPVSPVGAPHASRFCWNILSTATLIHRLTEDWYSDLAGFCIRWSFWHTIEPAVLVLQQLAEPCASVTTKYATARRAIRANFGTRGRRYLQLYQFLQNEPALEEIESCWSSSSIKIRIVRWNELVVLIMYQLSKLKTSTCSAVELLDFISSYLAAIVGPIYITDDSPWRSSEGLEQGAKDLSGSMAWPSQGSHLLSAQTEEPPFALTGGSSNEPLSVCTSSLFSNRKLLTLSPIAEESKLASPLFTHRSYPLSPSSAASLPQLSRSASVSCADEARFLPEGLVWQSWDATSIERLIFDLAARLDWTAALASSLRQRILGHFS